MAVSPGGSTTSGNSLVDSYLGQAAAQGAISGASAPAASPFDRYRNQWTVPGPDPRGGTPLPSRGSSNRGPYAPGAQRGNQFMNQPFVRKSGPAATQQQFLDQPFFHKFEADKFEEKREDERKRLIELAMKAGLIGENYLPSELTAIWLSAIDEAESASQMGEEVTPWQILEHWSNDPETARQYTNPGPSAPELEDLEGFEPEKRTVVQKSTTTNLTDPKTARAVILSGLRGVLGRKPTDAESRQFREYLNQLEQANPTISTTTQQFEGSDLTSSETETTGGAPTPSAAFETFQEDEFEEEAFAYRMGTEGADVLSMLGQSLA